MRTKTTGLILLVAIVATSLMACAGGGPFGGSSKSSAPLDLLPDDTFRLEVLDVKAILGGGVPEILEERFSDEWDTFYLGDDVVTIDDVDTLVSAFTTDGGILMMSGSLIDFAGVKDWLTSEEANMEETSYQGEELWGDDRTAMALLHGYLIFGDTEALKELLKVKARDGKGSLTQDSGNSVKKAYEDARTGWYVLASKNCDELPASLNLRACEGYSITGGRGEEDYLVDLTYRFLFRSESRAEYEALDIEDWLDDRGWNIDLEEVRADGASVEARASGDEEDFHMDWLISYSEY